MSNEEKLFREITNLIYEAANLSENKKDYIYDEKFDEYLDKIKSIIENNISTDIKNYLGSPIEYMVWVRCKVSILGFAYYTLFPRYYIIHPGRRNIEIVNLLLDMGFDPLLRNSDGTLPIYEITNIPYFTSDEKILHHMKMTKIYEEYLDKVPDEYIDVILKEKGLWINLLVERKLKMQKEELLHEMYKPPSGSLSTNDISSIGYQVSKNRFESYKKRKFS